MNAKFEITEFEPFTDVAKVVVDSGQHGVDGYYINAEVDVTQGGETRSFAIVLESEDSTGSMQARSGVEMSFAGYYSCGADEILELRKWLKGKNDALLDTIECELVKRAEDDCAHWLECQVIDCTQEFRGEMRAKYRSFFERIEMLVASKEYGTQALIEQLHAEKETLEDFFQNAQSCYFPLLRNGAETQEGHWFYDSACKIREELSAVAEKRLDSIIAGLLA